MSISGKFISLKIGDMMPVVVPGATDLAADLESDELDGTTGEDQGYDNPDDGCKKCTISGTLVIDVTDGSYVPITPGTLITNLKFYADIGADPVITLPLAKVFRGRLAGRVKERLTYEVTIKSKGPFTTDEPN